ncbi:MAG: iron-containing alcohol dehydrogenase [bacterium]
MWENAVAIDRVTEIRSKSNVFFGVGAIQKIDFILEELKNKGINSVLIMTGKGSYKVSGAWDHVEPALTKHGITYALYDHITPNPTADHVDTAVKKGLEVNAGAVLCIGGGSPVDAGKAAAIMLKYPEETTRRLFEAKFTPESAVPIIAINLTHGTGTEIDRFAVITVSETEHKLAIGYDFIYPMYSIDDPALMIGLSKEQTLFVSIDALNHAVETATTIIASPYSISLAKEAIRLIAKFLPEIMKNPEDLRARYFLLYASMISGIAFDNSFLHFTHALEHPLSAVHPQLAHGLGLSMILPAVIKYIYPATSTVLADILSPIVPNLEGKPSEALAAAQGVEKWLFDLGVVSKLGDEGFKLEDVNKLIYLLYETHSSKPLLSLAPVTAEEKVIRAIYEESFVPYLPV